MSSRPAVSRASSLAILGYGNHSSDDEPLPFVGRKDESSTHLPGATQQEEKRPENGRLIGGKYLEGFHGSKEDDTKYGELQNVHMDLPLTLWEYKRKNGEEYVVLKFADGDKENPYNWSNGRKAFITFLLCMMTLFIGLATTAYSSGIDSMVKDLGVSTELGQLGLFCFNMACALAPVSRLLSSSCNIAHHRNSFSSLLFVSWSAAVSYTSEPTHYSV